MRVAMIAFALGCGGATPAIDVAQVGPLASTPAGAERVSCKHDRF